MMTFTELAPASSNPPPEPFTDRLRLAVAAYLARFKGSSRAHTESDLRCYLAWCAERGLDPLAAQRPHLELYIRWMQEIRRFKPSTVSRRFSVTAGFYRTCVMDGLLQHSPAEHVRRPAVPAESPTLGLTHLQFEALLTAARESPNPYDFALVAMLGLLGLRIFEATGAKPLVRSPFKGAAPIGFCFRRWPTRRSRRGSGPTRTSGECLAAPNSRGNGRCMAPRGRCGLGRFRLTGAPASPGRVVTPRIPTTVEFQFIPHHNDTTYLRIAETGFTGTLTHRSAEQSSPPPVSPSCSAR
jgi:hypothetical protein